MALDTKHMQVSRRQDPALNHTMLTSADRDGMGEVAGAAHGELWMPLS